MASTVLDGSRPAAPLPDPTPSSAASSFAPSPLALYGFECSLETTEIGALEAVARRVTRAEVARWFAGRPATEEVALLSTCHRVELLLVASAEEEAERWARTLGRTRATWRRRTDRELVGHLFRVAAGRASLADREAEVRDQVRAAGRSVVSRHPRPVLRRVLLDAATTAESLASSRRSSGSIASVAAAYLHSLLPAPSPRVLVVGAGVVGRQVARSLGPVARLTIAYHSQPPSAEFLREVGATAVPLPHLREAARGSDALVTAAKFGDGGLGPADLPPDRPLVLVDLGMPRNIDPAVRALPGVRLVDLQELYERSRRSCDADDPDPALDAPAERCSEQVERLLWEPWIASLFRSAEATRRDELARGRPFLGALDPSQEAALDRLTRRLVARLVAPPAVRVRALPAGPAGDRARRLAVELLRPDPPGP